MKNNKINLFIVFIIVIVLSTFLYGSDKKIKNNVSNFKVFFRGKFGLADSNNFVVLDAVYDDMNVFKVEDDIYVLCLKDKKWSLLFYNSSYNNLTIHGSYEELPIPMYTPRGWGFISQNGDFVIKPEFVSAKAFSDGLALVLVCKHRDREKKCHASQYAYINKSGKAVIWPNEKYLELGPFKNGLAYFSIKVQNPKGFVEMDKVFYGYINKKNEVAIEPRFSFATTFENNRARVIVGRGYKQTLSQKAVTPFYKLYNSIGYYTAGGGDAQFPRYYDEGKERYIDTKGDFVSKP